MIPRWRTYASALLLGELEPAWGGSEPSPTESGLLEKYRRDWARYGSFPFAGELVSAALALNLPGEAREAAEYLLSGRGQASATARRAASAILGPASSHGPPPDEIVFEPTVAGVRRTAHILKRRLHDDPRNAFWWVDLARCYAMSAQSQRTQRAMSRAISLAPDNRFVLRSGARMHLHLGDYDAAANLLRRSLERSLDPWILAAEIAVSAVGGKRSRNLKRAQQMIGEGGVPARHEAELASALATEEMKHGSDRKARRLFERSLIAPTENSLAQAEWAGSHLSSLNVSPHLSRVPGAFEALYWEYSRAGEWARALEVVKRWLWDQPFSSWPAVSGSYLALLCLEDFEESARLATFGLAANPTEPLLLNNLAVALASSGRLDEARGVFGRIPVGSLSPHLTVVRTATAGLLALRSGDTSVGRQLYERASSLAAELRDDKLRALAALYYARQLVDLHLPGVDTAIRTAESAAGSVRDLDVRFALRRLLSVASDHPTGERSKSQ